MIAAVMVVKDEADIIEYNLQHHLAEGIEFFAIMDGGSTDGTRHILRDYQQNADLLFLMDQPTTEFDQPRFTGMLIEQARQRGATWIIPIDADEFFYSVDESITIREALDAQSPDIVVSCVRMYQQVNCLQRWSTGAKPLPKVVFRADHPQLLAPIYPEWGNHNIYLPGGSNWDVLSLREYQYRSFEHFLQKVAGSRALFASSPDAPPNCHTRYLAGLTIEQLHAEWSHIQSQSLVDDPLPSRIPCPL